MHERVHAFLGNVRRTKMRAGQALGTHKACATDHQRQRLTKDQTAKYIQQLPIAEKQLFVTMGAGDNWKIAQQLPLSL